MKKQTCLFIALLITCLASNNLLAQKTYIGYESWVTKPGTHDIRYFKTLAVGKDDSGNEATNTPTYLTHYNLYNDRGENYMIITVANYKKRQFVDIYMVPVNIAGEKDFNKMTYYQIKSEEFDGLSLIKKGIYNALGSRMYELDIAYVSPKKEHLKIKQIMDNDATDKIHYKLDN